MTPAPNTHNNPCTSPVQQSSIEVDTDTTHSINPFCVTDRLKTFSKWPVPFIRREDMANAGFVYTNFRDTVECPYCKISVGHWVETDIPFVEHEKYSPNCRFVRLRLAARVNESTRRSSSTDDGEDTCGPRGIENRQNDPVLALQHMSRDAIMQKLNVNTTVRPIHRGYVSYDDRLKTFDNWISNGAKLTAERLSEAGFVYAGESDRVWCFHCGGTLHSWDKSDDPWVEHAHWFPNCKYVRFVKGQQFVDCACLKKKSDLSKTEDEIKKAIEMFRELVSISDYEKLHEIDVNQSNQSLTEEKNQSSSSTSSATESDQSELFSSNSPSSGSDRESRMTCLCCLENERDTVLIPCYHIVACMNCAQKLTKCCFCREPVIYHRRVFIP